MFTRESVESWQEDLGPYYPVRVDYIGLGVTDIVETIPADFNDNDDTDFGIYEGDLTQYLPAAEITRSETSTRQLFWTRHNTTETPEVAGVQEILVAGAEWTISSIPYPVDLIEHLFSDAAYENGVLFEGTAPHCTNVAFEDGDALPEQCGDGSVANDDADLDIGVIGPP